MRKADDIDDLKEAVESLYQCQASWKKSVRINEKFKGQIVWHGSVSVYKLKDHPKATICYAWSSPIEGSTKRRYYAVLQLPPIKSAKDAVKASIVRDFKSNQ